MVRKFSVKDVDKFMEVAYSNKENMVFGYLDCKITDSFGVINMATYLSKKDKLSNIRVEVHMQEVHVILLDLRDGTGMVSSSSEVAMGVVAEAFALHIEEGR